MQREQDGERGEACRRCVLGAGWGRERDCPFRLRRFQRGEVLWRAGTPRPMLGYVVAGVVASLRPEAAVSDGPAALRGAGQIVGWEGVWQERAVTDVVAVTDAEVCLVAAARLWARCSDDHATALRVLREAVGEIALRSEESALRIGTCRQRLARFLLRRGERIGSPLQRLPLRWIARLLGMRPASLSRALRALLDEGVVGREGVRSRRGIEVRDLEQLRRAALGEAEAGSPWLFR